MVTPPKYVKDVLKTLEQHEHKAYLVGGCVRDMLMDRRPNDWDVATNATPDQVQSLFERTIPTGIKHGTVTVISGKSAVEVTTFRQEGEYGDNRRPDSVSYVGSLTEDLARRDFTMNAIALPLMGIISDPFNGREDIANRQIRCVGDPVRRFSEDALRMLRALRFSAKLDFTIEPETAQAISQCAHLCKTLSPERVQQELEKILLSQNPQVLAQVFNCGLMTAYAPGPCPPTDGFDRLGQIPDYKYQRWAALTAILEHYGAITSPLEFLRTLRLDNKTINAASMGAEIAKTSLPEDRQGWKLLLWRYGTQTVSAAAAAAEAMEDCGAVRALKSVLKSGECFSLKRLEISGDDLTALGFQPGVQVGTVLESLLRHVIAHPEDNKRNVLITRAVYMLRENTAAARH